MSWKWNEARPDYPRLYYTQRQRHQRYRRYVEAHGLPCQSCGVRGSHGYDSDYGPAEPCGWCESTGKVTRWMRGVYLRYMRDEKRQRRKKVA